MLHATFSLLYRSLYVHTIADRENFKVAKYAYISDFPIEYFLLLYVADYHLSLSNTISFCKIMVISIPFKCFLSVTICIYIYIYVHGHSGDISWRTDVHKCSIDRDRWTFLIARTRVTTASIGFYQTVSLYTSCSGLIRIRTTKLTRTSPRVSTMCYGSLGNYSHVRERNERQS